MRQDPAAIVLVQLFPPPAQASAVQVSPSSQLVAQQMLPLALDTQLFDAHWVPSEQAAPSTNKVPQVVAVPQTVELGQELELLMLQFPAPSQLVMVRIEPEHDALQAVPLARMWHWPAPSQFPSSPQGVPEAVQAPCGSVVALTGLHCPVVWPVRLFVHAEQPVHALSQQTPSTQCVLAHSVPAVHV